MLQSMIEKPRPTRAECSDVGNAVLDGADTVMLSGESAKGAYPVLTVQTMRNICREVESMILHKTIFSDLLLKTDVPTDTTTAVAISAVEISLNSFASAIIVLTTTGR